MKQELAATCESNKAGTAILELHQKQFKEKGISEVKNAK